MPIDTSDAALRATLQHALQAELVQIDPEAGLAQLHVRLRADAAHAPAAPAGRSWRAGLRQWFTRWPSALASLVIVLQAGLLAWQFHPTDMPQNPDLTWRSTGLDALGPAPMQLQVRFAPQATVQAITALLGDVQSQAIAGPDASGQWTLAVPAAQAAAALARLRASPLVQAASTAP
jgi:hypothetical protein